MAWDILGNILFVGILYMVIPYLVATAVWAQVMKLRSDRTMAGRGRTAAEDDPG